MSNRNRNRNNNGGTQAPVSEGVELDQVPTEDELNEMESTMTESIESTESTEPDAVVEPVEMTEEEKLIAEINADARRKIAEIKARKREGKVVEQIRTCIDQLNRLLADPMDTTTVSVVVKTKTIKTYRSLNSIL